MRSCRTCFPAHAPLPRCVTVLSCYQRGLSVSNLLVCYLYLCIYLLPIYIYLAIYLSIYLAIYLFAKEGPQLYLRLDICCPGVGFGGFRLRFLRDPAHSLLVTQLALCASLFELAIDGATGIADFLVLWRFTRQLGFYSITQQHISECI